MPIYIALKEPKINLIVAGEIKDKDEKFYDGLFNGGVIMTEDRKGQKIVIPIWKESNISFMRTITDREIKENEIEMKKMQEAAAKGGGGGMIDVPGFGFPGRKQKRGGGITL